MANNATVAARVISFKIGDTQVRASLGPANLITSVRTTGDAAVLGDTVTETTFSNYEEYRRRAVSHAHRAEAGRLSDPRSDGQRRAATGQRADRRAVRRAIGRGASAGRGARRHAESRRRHLLPDRRQPSLGRRRIQGLRRRRRGAADRRPCRRRVREREEDHSEQADQVRRELTQPLRSPWRCARGDGRGLHRRHAVEQQAVLREESRRCRTRSCRIGSRRRRRRPLVEGVLDKRVFTDETQSRSSCTACRPTTATRCWWRTCRRRSCSWRPTCGIRRRPTRRRPSP